MTKEKRDVVLMSEPSIRKTVLSGVNPGSDVAATARGDRDIRMYPYVREVATMFLLKEHAYSSEQIGDGEVKFETDGQSFLSHGIVVAVRCRNGVILDSSQHDAPTKNHRMAIARVCKQHGVPFSAVPFGALKAFCVTPQNLEVLDPGLRETVLYGDGKCIYSTVRNNERVVSILDGYAETVEQADQLIPVQMWSPPKE